MAKKAPDAFRTISEVSDALDTPAHVLRFWESKFSQIKPVKRAGGRRYYRPDDIDLLSGIKSLLHEQGMTIKGAQKLLREKGVKHVTSIAPLSAETVPDASPVIDVKPVKKTKAKATSKKATVAAEKPAAAMPAAPTLPGLDIQSAPTPPGLLSSLATADSMRLAPRAEQIAPLAAKLAKLHAKMAAL